MPEMQEGMSAIALMEPRASLSSQTNWRNHSHARTSAYCVIAYLGAVGDGPGRRRRALSTFVSVAFSVSEVFHVVPMVMMSEIL